MKNMKQDRRTKYTRMVIKDSLIEIMENKAFKDVTVTELCKVAEINRSTFYNHYYDTADVLENIENELFKDLVEHIDEILKDNNTINFVKLLKMFYQKKQIYTIIFNENNDSKLLDRLLQTTKDKTLNSIASKNNNMLHSIYDYYFSYISGASIATIKKWILSGMNESPEIIAKLLETLTKSTEQSIYSI